MARRRRHGGRGAPLLTAEHEIAAQPCGTGARLGFPRQPRDLSALYERHAPGFADGVAMVAGERTWTFRDARADALAMAAVLHADCGVRPGDRVAIVSASSPEHALAIWAAVFAGAVVTGLNGWWTAAELSYAIDLTRPVIALGDTARLERIRPGTVPLLDLADLLARARAADHTWARQRSTKASTPPVAREPDDPAMILFTSGTTGRPKGAALSHRNIVHYVWTSSLMAASAAGAATSPAPSRRPATIAASPMFHLSGLLTVLMTGPVRGTTLVFPPPGRWDPEAQLRLTEEHQVTTWGGVPTQYWRLLHHPRFDAYDLSSLTSLGVGGAALAPELLRELRRRLPGARIFNSYGMTETVGLGTRIETEDLLAHPASVGRACPTVEIEIRGADGLALKPGEVGEICLRTGSVFLGYWNDPGATAAALTPDGWYRTGDHGRLDDGRLVVESRVRDLVIRAGENIAPVEIEHRLIEHPDIRDAAVVGVDHAELGQEVKAVVVLRDGAHLDADAVRAWVGDVLAPFKVPAHVEVRSSLPYTETGKVQKHLL